MANNELSGPLIQILIFLKLKKLKKRKFNYLFVINPETKLMFYSCTLDYLKQNLISGIVTCLGGSQKNFHINFLEKAILCLTSILLKCLKVIKLK